MFEKKWNIKKLYLAYPSLLTSDLNHSKFYYNEDKKESKPIVVKKINAKYVKNILTNKIYAIFGRLDKDEYEANLREYVVSRLTPLESLKRFKGKATISETELKKMLNKENKENKEISNEIKEPFLVCILETVEKVKKSNLSLEEKAKLANELSALLDYYKSGLERINHFDNEIKLTTTPNTLLALREECLVKLTVIEEMLPRNLENNDDDFKLLRKRIDSLINE